MRVFPVHEIEREGCSCGKLACPSAGKHPRIKDWQMLATCDETEIAAWWRTWPHSNIGVACGEGSNLTVLDVDGEEGRWQLRELEGDNGDLPQTPVAITGSGGAHYYFAFEPGLGNAVKFAAGLDVRTEGGLVVGVGSATKQPYRWEAAFTLGSEGLTPARMPQWLAEKIRGASIPQTNGHLVLPDAIPAGERNNWLYRLTRSLKARGMGAGAILLAVQSENTTRCSPPMPDDEIRALVGHATTEPDQRGFQAPAVQNGSRTIAARPLLICQNQEQAAVANAAYLARPEIIERLGFAQSIGLMIGGKHHGKTTNVRTLALSVMRGLPIWERRTSQGPVIYVASDDEMASTRHELLNMGWNAKDDPLTLVGIDPDGRGQPEEILHEIGELALREGAILIILDMLFDFVAVKDELGYQDTRSAMAPVMRLADMTKAFVVGSHHTPKYLNDAHNAANAALGSQGVAARFSPIIFTRKWTETLFTVESTMTRDPRGEALKPVKIIKNGSGWIEAAGEFKEWMKWEIYAEGVMAVFEGGQRNLGETVYSVAEKTNLDRSRVQNALFQLTKLGKLKREKQGRAWKYYLPDVSMFEREGGNFESSGDAMQKTTKPSVAVHGVDVAKPRKLWGDEGEELDENGIPKWK
jgi:putative DNA primase/helicase